jgi:hypothetical protein
MLEQKMDAARQKLDEEKRVLEALRDTLDASNAIKVLEEECQREVGHLEDAVADETSRLQELNIERPGLPKGDDDDSGERLIQVLEATGKFEQSCRYSDYQRSLTRSASYSQRVTFSQR